MNGKGKLCVLLKSAQVLNLNTNQKLSFAVKLSHRATDQPICKWSLIAVHNSAARGWPHKPGVQYCTTHNKILFLNLYTSPIKLMNVVIQDNTVLLFSWTCYPTNKCFISQSLATVKSNTSNAASLAVK